MGILSLQMAHTAEAARSILASWGQAAKRHARLSLDWDMGFAVAYALFLAVLMERAGRVAGRLGIIGAWLPIWAGSSDLVENLFHMSLVSDTAQASAADLGFLTHAAFVFATIKWVLLACWLAVFSLCLGAIVICRLRRMRCRSQAK